MRENRLFSQVKKNKNHNDIRECHRKVIWSWKEKHETFCLRRDRRQDRNTVNSSDTSALDGLIRGIESDETDLVLSSVHWRISLLLITLVKSRVCKDTTDPKEIATCFQSNGLVSTGKFNYFKNNVSHWAEAGEKYKDLSLKLGGYGSLIYLPDIGRTKYVYLLYEGEKMLILYRSYEAYYFPSRESGYAVVGALTPSIAPAAAQKFDGFNAHNVVDAIVQSTIDRIKDLRLTIIPARYADTQQSKRTSRAEKNPLGNQASQARKRLDENGQGTPGSKIRRVGARRAGTKAATTRGANIIDDNPGAGQSDPPAAEAALLLSTIRDGRPNLPGSEQSPAAYPSQAACTPIHSRRTAHHSFAEAETSLSPPVSVAGRATSSTVATEATSDVDSGRNIMSSEATSVISMSGETSRHWTSSFAAGCNSQFQSVNNGLSAENADLLPSTFRNQQVESAVFVYQDSVRPDSEVLRHSAQYSEGIETNRNYANYAHVPVTDTESDHSLNASISAQFQRTAVDQGRSDGSSDPESYNFTAPQSPYNGFPNSYGYGNSQQSFNGFPNSYEFTSSQQSYSDFPNSYNFRNSQQPFNGFPNSYEFAATPQFYSNFPNSYDSASGFEPNVT